MTVALSTPVELLQDEWEFNALLDLYCEHQPTRVLEIGAGQGGTLYHWLTNAVAGTTIVTIDDQHTNSIAYQDWVPHHIELITIRGNSHDPDTILTATKHGPYQWIFIDADHHDHAVRADWNNYSPLTTPGAIVAFHDTIENADPSVQVAPLWRELRDQYESAELVETGGFGIGVIYMPDRLPQIRE